MTTNEEPGLDAGTDPHDEDLFVERDFLAEMRRIIDEMAVGSYSAPQLAQSIIGKLDVNDPELLNGWLDANAVALLTQIINARDRSQRTRARLQHKASVFGDDAKAFEAGDTKRIIPWLTVHYALKDNIRKPLAELTADDLRFVAKRYDDSAKISRFEAIFFEKMAERVGNKTVAEVYSDQEIINLRKLLEKKSTL
jgi:hypothetical protein